jgi:Uma2 family endonuclease
MPDLRKAELLRGVVCLARPRVRVERHGRPHGVLIHWLCSYEEATPGVQTLCGASLRLDLGSEPQPDAILRVKPECGGRTATSEDDYVEGPPELIAEVSASTVRIDLGLKRAIYRERGVSEYLVIRPERRRVDWFRLEGSLYVAIQADADGLLRSRVFPGLWLDTPALLRGDLRQLREVIAEGTASTEHARFLERLGSR